MIRYPHPQTVEPEKRALHFQCRWFSGNDFSLNLWSIYIYIVIYYIVIYIISHLILMSNFQIFQYIHSFNDFFHRPHPPKGLVDHQRLGVRMARVPFLTWILFSIQQLSIRMSWWMSKWILRVRKKWYFLHVFAHGNVPFSSWFSGRWLFFCWRLAYSLIKGSFMFHFHDWRTIGFGPRGSEFKSNQSLSYQEEKSC